MVTSTLTVAYAKPTPLYGADFLSSNNGVTLNEDTIYGATYNTFNRFRDNWKLCQQNGFYANGKCTDTNYMDEREFVTLRKVGRLGSNGTVQITNADERKFHDYTSSDLKEGDVVRAYLYVHNNASTIYKDSRYEARDVQVHVTLDNRTVSGKITAKNAFVEEPDYLTMTAYKNGYIPNVSATFEDAAFVNLPTGYELGWIQGNSSLLAGRVAKCGSIVNDKCQLQVVGDPFPLNGGAFSLSGKTFTYSHGRMVGSKENDMFVMVDLVVKKSQGGSTGGSTGGNTGSTTGGSTGIITPPPSNAETPGTYQRCVSGVTLARFVWANAQIGDTLTLEHTPNGGTMTVYTQTVSTNYGSMDHQSLRSSNGQTPYLRAGDRLRWRVGKDTRFSSWYEATVQDCANLQDGLRLGVLPSCANPVYSPSFQWNTSARNKVLEVSTDPTFATYFRKDVSNLTQTTGPDGFSYFEPYNRTLKFEGEKTYYWRLRLDGQIYPGPSFKVPTCLDRECDDNGYTGPDDTCTDDGKIIVHDDKECRPGVCACVEIEVDPKSAGDYNVATFTTNISNKSTTSQTVTKRAEIYNLRPDGKKGYQITSMGYVRGQGSVAQIFDDTCTNGKNSEGQNCVPKEEGSFQVTGVKATPKPSSNRNSFAGASANPIGIDFTDFAKDQRKPVIVTNLYPGDSVDLMVTGIARTSLPGKEFSPETNDVNYNYFMKSPSNNGVKELTIARPFLITVNDGDTLTSGILKGLSNFTRVFSNVMGVGNAISGVKLENNQSAVNRTNLGFGNTVSGITIVADQNKTAGSSVSILSESDLSRLNIRPDKTRIFSAKNQNITVGSLASSALTLAERSTIYLEKGNVTINSDIAYANGAGTPSFAIIVRDGDIFIHPRVKRIDAVIVVLGTGKIRGTSDWRSYYESGAGQPQTLVVNGALYGNIDDLIPSRPNVTVRGSGINDIIQSSGITVNFDGRIYSFPPPGLREILGGVYDLLRN
ncbi:hypothetical protein COW46_02090 [Candidatus Gracilibacteria bacterium CG17_big_fil_post_rev_8_21_14_2_50_48_13]|nr:MAG: hypothetical protein COW46_02090 [Candidatus Gracilibacteria bacterium CG17_big_fil_post_rev_8_21_14_2_50_48_13]